MPLFINIADLKDPCDSQGRSYRQVNAEKVHTIPIGALVEIETGARAFVVRHTRDCDQTPLYSLAIDIDPEQHKFSMCHGRNEESLKQITQHLRPTSEDRTPKTKIERGGSVIPLASKNNPIKEKHKWS